MTTIRPPAVAGSFYPDDAAMLSAVVEDFLAEVPVPPGADWPKALIAPHAGYIYSGPVAASAYARLKPAAGRVRRVVVIIPPSSRICRNSSIRGAGEQRYPVPGNGLKGIRLTLAGRSRSRRASSLA